MNPKNYDSMFPICVGMNRPEYLGGGKDTNVPHMCGDEPLVRMATLLRI